MRPIERIEPFLKELGDIWKERFPDWRFGQLIYNFIVRTEIHFVGKMRSS